MRRLIGEDVIEKIIYNVLRGIKEQCVNGEGCDQCWYHQFCTLLPEEWEI